MDSIENRFCGNCKYLSVIDITKHGQARREYKACCTKYNKFVDNDKKLNECEGSDKKFCGGKRIIINGNYVLSEPERIDHILVIQTEKPYIMIHTEKSSFRINLQFKNINNVYLLDIIDCKLSSILYEDACRIRIYTDRQITIIDGSNYLRNYQD